MKLMNELSPKLFLLAAALRQLGSVPPDWRQPLLEGVSLLCDELIELTSARECGYEHGKLKSIRGAIEDAFKHPETNTSAWLEAESRTILPGFPDVGAYA